jgi:hypothetical protein
MVELSTIEKTTRNAVVESPFTRIQGLPTWLQKTRLIEEMEEAAMACDVSYPWAGDYGLLALIDGPVKYLARTGLIYVEPVKPTPQHPTINIGTAAIIKQKEVENDLWLRDYAVLLGFIKGCGENMRDALCSKYYEQLKEDTFKYKRIKPRQYLTELETKWVFLDERQRKTLIDNYERGWEENEHISAFATRLDDEQAKLLADGITISDENKKSHYILEMWNCKRFSEPVMSKWTNRLPARKTWARAKSYFEKKAGELDKYELTNGVGDKPNEFAGAATEMKEQLQRAIEAIERKDEEHALAMREAKNEAKELRDQVAALAKMIDSLSSEVKRKKRVPRRRRSVSPTPSSEDDESSDEEQPPTPPRPRKNKRKAQVQSGREKRKGKATFGEDDTYYANTKWNPDWAPADRKNYFIARTAFWKTNTKAARADELAKMKEKHERAARGNKE